MEQDEFRHFVGGFKVIGNSAVDPDQSPGAVISPAIDHRAANGARLGVTAVHVEIHVREIRGFVNKSVAPTVGIYHSHATIGVGDPARSARFALALPPVAWALRADRRSA